MNTDDASSIHEDALLSEESDVLSGGTSNTNYAILTVLQSLNKNMTEMGESLRSLKRKRETQTPQRQNLPNENEYPRQRAMALTQKNPMQINCWMQTNALKLSAKRATAPRAKPVQITKAILYSMKSRSLSPTRRKLPRKCLRNLQRL